MILDMSEALIDLEQPVIIKNINRVTVDFVERDVVTVRSQQCVIQSADKDKLNPSTIDYSNDYITVHSREMMNNGELIEYREKDYKFIGKGDFTDYGYCEQLAEETKRPLVTE